MSFISKDKVFIKNLSMLAVPIIFQEMLNSSVNMMDTFMIGQLGAQEVASVGLANQIFFLFTLIVFGINSGSSVFMGQYWGRKDVDSIHKVMGICFILSSLAALVFFSGAMFFPESVMKIYSKDSAVIALGQDYLRVIAFSYFLSAIIVSLNASLRVTGNTKFPMITTFISLTTNVVCNYIFIFVLDMGVKGAAFGTVIARSLELMSQIFFINKFKLPSKAKIKDYFSLNLDFFKACMIITLPVILNEFMWALGTSVYNIAYKYSGTEAQAAMQIAGTVQNLFVVVGMGVGAGCGIMIANTIGAGDSEKAISYSRKCLLMSVILSIFMGIFLALISPFIVSLFDVENNVKEFAHRCLFVVSVGMIVKTFNYTSIVGILRNGGDTKFCLILDTMTVWCVGVPFAFLGSAVLHLPIYWTFSLVYLEEVFKFFISGYRVYTNKWINSVID